MDFLGAFVKLYLEDQFAAQSKLSGPQPERRSQNPGLPNVSASVITSTSTHGILYNLIFSVPSILVLRKVDIF